MSRWWMRFLRVLGVGSWVFGGDGEVSGVWGVRVCWSWAID